MINENDIKSEIIRTFDEEILALSNAKTNILNGEIENYQQAVAKIAKANKLIVTGIGKSGIIAKKIAATFSSIGTPAIFLHPVEALHGDLGIVQEGDVAILLSKSGTTDEIVKLLPFLKAQKAELISITGNPDSFLAKKADVFLNAAVTKEVCPHNLAPTSSTTLTLVIGDALAIGTMKMREVSLDSFSRLHPLGQIGRNVTMKAKDIMYYGEKLPILRDTNSLKEAIIEITAKGLGAVCIVDENNKLLGLITDGDLRRVLHQNIDIRTLSVNEVMTKSPVTCSAETYLGEALAIMEQRSSQINVLPITEDDKLMGLIRIHDIIKSGL